MLKRLAQLFAAKLSHKAQSDAALDRGDWASAIDNYRQALVRDPLDAASCNNLARALAQAGRRDEASFTRELENAFGRMRAGY